MPPRLRRSCKLAGADNGTDPARVRCKSQRCCPFESLPFVRALKRPIHEPQSLGTLGSRSRLLIILEVQHRWRPAKE